MRILLFVSLATVGACNQQPAGAYPPQYELNFMRACQAQNAPVEFCSCSWDKIEREIPAEDFAAFERLPANEQAAHPLREQIRRYAEECQSEAVDPAADPPAP